MYRGASFVTRLCRVHNKRNGNEKSTNYGGQPFADWNQRIAMLVASPSFPSSSISRRYLIRTRWSSIVESTLLFPRNGSKAFYNEAFFARPNVCVNNIYTCNSWKFSPLSSINLFPKQISFHLEGKKFTNLFSVVKLIRIISWNKRNPFSSQKIKGWRGED